MKHLLVIFLSFIILHLSFIISVQAVCVKNINLPASGDNLGCSSGTCQELIFPAETGPACPNYTNSNCWCVGGNPPPTVPPMTASPNPSASPTPTPSDYTSPPSCRPSEHGNPDSALSSRPVPCENCNQTQNLTPSCATTFAANDEITFRSSRNDFSCQNQAWVKDSWSGTITIDPKDTKLPFVGKKGEESESKYLADYFEGTKSYEPAVDLEDCKTCKNSPTSASCTLCQQKLKEVLNRGGVFPKLAPKEIQDDLKEKMINRAVKSLAGTAGYDQAIHDYMVSVKDGTQVLTAQLSEFVGHLPPKPEDYTGFNDQTLFNAWKTAYDNWQNSKWGKLWVNVPMFSREDTSGYVTSYVGPRQEDVIGPQNPKSEIERVPHLARLNEVTEALQKLLLPFQSSQQSNSLVQNNNDTAIRIAVSKEAKANNTGSKVLGEQTPECFNLTPEISTSPATGGTRVCVTLKICSPEGGGDGHVMVWVDGKLTIVNNPWKRSKENPCFSVMPEWAGCFFVPNGGGVNLPEYSVTLDRCKDGIVRKNIASCGITADAKGKVNTTCALVPPPIPEPVCGLPPAASVPNCNKNNVVQSDDGDKLCCNQTSFNVSAVDTFVNPFYQDYLKNYNSCFNNCINQSGMNDQRCDNRCDPQKSVPVSRGVQVALRHPYLFKIWQQTNDTVSGLFNILRPEAMPKFNDNPAASEIDYKYKSNKPNNPTNSASPQTGQFYFPFLGGVQQAKEEILKLLNPQ